MILQRLASAIRHQNWSQIIIEILIVVIGIFLGLQVQAWYDIKQDKEAYKLALDRLLLEHNENYQDMQTAMEELGERVSINEAAFDALLSCVDSAENEENVNAAFNNITGTMGIRIRSSALQEITQNQRFLDLQSPEMRNHLSDFHRNTELWVIDSYYAEELPLTERIQNNALISVGDKEIYNFNYHGFKLTVNPRRVLELNVPVSVACKDNDLLKSFYTWERWQALQLANMVVFKAQYIEEIKYLEELSP